jgi:hypothetical protein
MLSGQRPIAAAVYAYEPRQLVPYSPDWRAAFAAAEGVVGDALGGGFGWCDPFNA